MAAVEVIDVDGRRLSVSNLDKVLYPATGFTKGDLLRYYQAIAPWLLPHLRGRALTVARWPDGVEAPGWYQSNCRSHPPWLRTALVMGRRAQPLRSCIVDDLAPLLWVANLAAIELHPALATVEDPDRPRLLLFDLDPGLGKSLVDTARVAVELRDALAAAGLGSYPRSTGHLGLHVIVPLDGGASFAETKPFARAVAQALAARRPDAVVATMGRAQPSGRVLIDWGHNDRARQTIAPYSLRATRRPHAAAPLGWDEVEQAIAAGDGRRLLLTPEALLARAARAGDRFADVLNQRA